MTWSDVLAITAAGMVGFDPTGAIVAAAAISLGAKRRTLVALAVSCLVTISIVGTTATWIARVGFVSLDPSRYLPPARTLLYLEAGLGVILLVVGLLLALRPRRTHSEPAGRWLSPGPGMLSSAGLAVAGAVVALLLVVDAGFLLMVGLSVSLPTVIHPLAFLYWGAWSQILLLITVLATILDRRGRVVARLTKAIEGIRARTRTIAAVLLTLVGLIVLVKAVYRLGTLHLLGV